MDSSVQIVYYIMKAAYLFSLVRILVKFDVMQRYFLFLAILYTAGIAFLSFVFVISWRLNPVLLHVWEVWLVSLLGLTTLYFWLLTRFDESSFFWIILLAGVGLIWF